MPALASASTMRMPRPVISFEYQGHCRALKWLLFCSFALRRSVSPGPTPWSAAGGRGTAALA